MHPVLKHLLDTEFSDLAGSSIEGQFAITDELVNLGLHDLIAKLTQPSAPSTAPAAPAVPKTSTTELPDPKVLLQHVKIEHVKYRTEAGRTILELKAGL
ncbi:hypothetical protein LEM8419_00802 [Neolewinella maritima]|uniref:Uncharacterized protein n=1 Tax=Neolewinella maritima TaxID=1383882 RepID=A0ABN8F5J5_9BACT|nr:hypothetical protein [Neolewinella maritima]CAH0999502.1 hypothetical protein LEM8419_00802 [Neolewinella maritima]